MTLQKAVPLVLLTIVVLAFDLAVGLGMVAKSRGVETVEVPPASLIKTVAAPGDTAQTGVRAPLENQRDRPVGDRLWWTDTCPSVSCCLFTRRGRRAAVSHHQHCYPLSPLARPGVQRRRPVRSVGPGTHGRQPVGGRIARLLANTDPWYSTLLAHRPAIQRNSCSRARPRAGNSMAMGDRPE
jgi:hypothetical protein